MEQLTVSGNPGVLVVCENTDQIVYKAAASVVHVKEDGWMDGRTEL
jgi:hypothetical protein